MSNNKLAKLIIEKLHTPTDWRVDQHTARHIPSGVEVWIASGKWRPSIWRAGRHEFPISWRQRFQMWKLIKAIPEPEDRNLAAAYAALNAIEINPPANPLVVNDGLLVHQNWNVVGNAAFNALHGGQPNNNQAAAQQGQQVVI